MAQLYVQYENRPTPDGSGDVECLEAYALGGADPARDGDRSRGIRQLFRLALAEAAAECDPPFSPTTVRMEDITLDDGTVVRAMRARIPAGTSLPGDAAVALQYGVQANQAHFEAAA